LADVSTSSAFTRAEAKLFSVHEEDIQALVCPDKSADECAVVVGDYSKSAAKDTPEIPDGVGVSHQITKEWLRRSDGNGMT
jgi:hypothetical protein